jgi:hypothetical protein
MPCYEGVPSTILILRARVVAEVDASLKAVTRAGETKVNKDKAYRGYPLYQIEVRIGNWTLLLMLSIL